MRIPRDYSRQHGFVIRVGLVALLLPPPVAWAPLIAHGDDQGVRYDRRLGSRVDRFK
jgi:hypothetical protein